MNSRSINYVLLALLALGILSRVLAALYCQIEPVSDFKRYYDVAVEFASTGELTRNGFPFISQPPLYPLALGSIFKLTGPSVLIGVYFNLALSLLTLMLFLCFILKALDSSKFKIMALALFSLYPAVLGFLPILGVETLSLFLVVLIMLLFCYEGLFFSLFVGILISALTLTKAQYILLIAPIVIRLFILRKFGSSIMLMAGFLMVISPWIFRNYQLFDRPIAVSSNGGYTAFVNNNKDNLQSGWMPLSSIELSDDAKKAFAKVNALDLFREGDESEKMFLWTPAMDSIAAAEAVKWIISDPIRFIELGGLRLGAVFIYPAYTLLQWVFYTKGLLFFISLYIINLSVLLLTFGSFYFLVKNPILCVKNNLYFFSVLFIGVSAVSVFIFEGQGRYIIPLIPVMIFLSFSNHWRNQKI